jgi:glyoxalase family protein
VELGGLHHVTAVTADAPGNVGFHTNQLGMRLVKKTVNQDDVSAYHLFYGDEVGNPGTELTFFDWAWAGPQPAGSGMISEIGLRVPDRAALDWWAERLDSQDVPHEDVENGDEEARIRFTDPEGQRLALVHDEREGAVPGTPWGRSPVPRDKGIQGLDSVTLDLARLEPTAMVLEKALGFRAAGEGHLDGYRTATYEVGPGGPGARVTLVERPDLPPHRRNGAGGVHHVAFRTPDEETHAAWREHLARIGLGVTPVIDRHYFKAIYFREPGGVLFEISTDGPGFATDEDPENLGEKLSLPPFLEDRREEIEAGLTPLPTAGVAR